MIMQFDLVLYFIVFTSANLQRQDTKQIATGALVNIGNNCPSIGKILPLAIPASDNVFPTSGQ